MCCDDYPGARVLTALSNKRLKLAARACRRILKIARTIADRDDAPDLQPTHVSEAIQYRSLDRRGM
jgi:magnesium chelatase family protein